MRRAARGAGPTTGSRTFDGIVTACSPLRRLIEERIRERRAAANLDGRQDAPSVLVREAGLDDQALCDEVLTLLVAGHDTTATALAWAIERLTHQPVADLDAFVRDQPD